MRAQRMQTAEGVHWGGRVGSFDPGPGGHLRVHGDASHGPRASKPTCPQCHPLDGLLPTLRYPGRGSECPATASVSLHFKTLHLWFAPAGPALWTTPSSLSPFVQAGCLPKTRCLATLSHPSEHDVPVHPGPGWCWVGLSLASWGAAAG